MTNYNLRFLQDRIRHIRYAILKVSGNSFAQFSNGLADTILVDDEGVLWCSLSDEIPALLLNQHEFRVRLKYIDKDQGFFIRLSGNARIVHSSKEMGELLNQNEILLTPVNRILLKIKITNADLFKKRILSRYTSVLQSVFNFSVKTLLHRTEKIPV